MDNSLLKSENIKIGTILRCDVICIFIDIRNSTNLNEVNNDEYLYEIYSSILDNSYKIFKVNAFKNIEIQGDGIYALTEYNRKKPGHKNKLRTVAKCLNELNNNIINSHEKYKINSTISVRTGEEVISAFGMKDNNNKQIAYFGNVVSKTKKMNSLSQGSKIVISKKFSEEELKILMTDEEYKDVWLKNGGNLGEVKLNKW